MSAEGTTKRIPALVSPALCRDYGGGMLTSPAGKALRFPRIRISNLYHRAIIVQRIPRTKLRYR